MAQQTTATLVARRIAGGPPLTLRLPLGERGFLRGFLRATMAGQGIAVASRRLGHHHDLSTLLVTSPSRRPRATPQSN